MISAPMLGLLAAPGAAPAAWLGLPLCLGLCLVLGRLARSRGLLDCANGPLAARKLQAEPVPPVGGLGIALSLLLLAWGLGWNLRARLPLPGEELLVGQGMLWLSLGLALLLGLWDDLLPAGLGAMGKLGGQALALFPLAMGAAGLASQTGWGAATLAAPGLLALFVLVAGVAAMNVLNTFDNADGAAGGVACMGFAAAALAVPGSSGGVQSQASLAVLLGFLWLNTNARSGARGAGSGSPSVYLGDSGAFFLGLLLLLQPGAWGALWIPALDLARLSWVRLRAGSRPWIGDRRHLAHRLQRRGLGPRQVLFALALVSAPGCWAAARAQTLSLGLASGLGAGALGFGALLAWTHGMAEPERRVS